MGIIKTCSEYLKESVWGGMLSRSTGDVKRKEDEYHPEYFDFGEGTTVYWATNNLEIDGKIEFQFEEIKDYNNNGWRLPTEEEVKQLKWIKPYTSFKDNCIDFLVRGPKESSGKYLRLTRDYIGIGSAGTTISKRNGTLTHMWTSDVAKFNSARIITYGFDNTPAFCPLAHLKDERLPVFLVKDKKSED